MCLHALDGFICIIEKRERGREGKGDLLSATWGEVEGALRRMQAASLRQDGCSAPATRL